MIGKTELRNLLIRCAPSTAIPQHLKVLFLITTCKVKRDINNSQNELDF